MRNSKLLSHVLNLLNTLLVKQGNGIYIQKNSQTEAKLLDLANWMGTLQVVFVALSCMNGTGHNTVPELPQSS